MYLIRCEQNVYGHPRLLLLDTISIVAETPALGHRNPHIWGCTALVVETPCVKRTITGIVGHGYIYFTTVNSVSIYAVECQERRRVDDFWRVCRTIELRSEARKNWGASTPSICQTSA